jgi:hypothetical protein
MLQTSFLLFSFSIISSAWILDPEKRPRFADILPDLESLRGRADFQVISRVSS